MRHKVDLQVPMRDGVLLSTDIRWPDGPGPFPVVVLRTPYNNCDPTHNLRYVHDGYVFVAQDCRGRFDSAGIFHPFHDEEDGEDLIEWIMSQPWCDGRIGMVGGSYCGYTQLSAARMTPKGLLAITPRVMGCNLFKDTLYNNGVLALSLAVSWGLGMTGRGGQALGFHDIAAIQKLLPLNRITKETGLEPGYFKTWLEHSTYDGYWKNQAMEENYEKVNVPALHMGGWYDLYSEGILRNFEGISKRGGPAARAHQKIIMGPWGHGLGTRSCGQIDFGLTAASEAIDDMEKRWLQRWVLGVENGIDKEPPVRIFVMGTNVWRDEQEWPLKRAVDTRLYMQSPGRANSLYGNGELLPEPATTAGQDGYVYNPLNPVPTVGGNGFAVETGPNDHRPIERRDDVLVYTGPTLQEPIEVTGYVSAEIHVESDCPDTDFVVRLCDVYPDGRSIVICDGIARMSFREGLDRKVLMNPGEIYKISVPMGVTSITFLPGHSIRVEVTSSSFPRWARNLNTGEESATSDKVRIANNKLHHSPKLASHVILPVVPQG